MPASLSPVMSIPERSEPGERLVISGAVYKADGKTPWADAILYAYHTDSTGHYSKEGIEKGFQKWHGRLHGWCRTDARGRYEIRSIRPGRYPDNSMPAHIHCAIKKPDGSEPFFINDFVFSDDSLVTSSYLSTLSFSGGDGIVDLKKDKQGDCKGHRDILLAR